MAEKKVEEEHLAACAYCQARKKGVCSALSEEQLKVIGKSARRYFIKPNTNIDREQDKNAQYGNILCGVVKLTKLMRDGRQQIVGLHFAPDFVGAPFDVANDCEIETAGEVQICSFPKDIMDQMIQESPELERKLHEKALNDLADARDWLLTLGRKSAVEKVASFLFLVVRHQVHDDLQEAEDLKPVIELPLKRHELADFLGLTIETVSRKMTDLKKMGIVEIQDRKSVKILSIRKLKAACDPDDI